MADSQLLCKAIKQVLKTRGLTYRDLAGRLDLSEASIKRMFALQKLSLERVFHLCDVLQISFADLALRAEAMRETMPQLDWNQEELLVADTRLLLVAVCVLNQWQMAEIVTAYQITEEECIQKLLMLERIGILQLMPENRVKLKVARDFDWLPNGPIHHFFQTKIQKDFLDQAHMSIAGVPASQQQIAPQFFIHGMFTPEALDEIQADISRMRQKISNLHLDNLHHPKARKISAGFLVALRMDWEPQMFSKMRRATTLES